MPITVYRPGGGFDDPLGGHNVWAPPSDALGPLPSGLFNPRLPDGYVPGTGLDAGQPYGPMQVGMDLLSGLTKSFNAENGGAAMSNALVNAVLAHTGLERNVGGRVGAQIGSVALTPFLGPLGPVAGAALGSQFGPGPSVGPGATAGIDLLSGQPWGYSGDNGGQPGSLGGFLGNQVADLYSALAGYGGTLDLSRIQYGNQPGNRSGPLNQFAAYDQSGAAHILPVGGIRPDGNGNYFDMDPHELIRALKDAGLYTPADAQGLDEALGPRKLLYSPEQLDQINAASANDQRNWNLLLGGGG